MTHGRRVKKPGLGGGKGKKEKGSHRSGKYRFMEGELGLELGNWEIENGEREVQSK